MEVVEKLPISVLKSGDLKFLKELNLDPESEIQAIVYLSEISTVIANICKQHAIDPLSHAKVYQTQQWVKEVTAFSTEYGPNMWSRNCIIGQFSTYPQYGDINTSWAPSSSTGTIEFLEFKYPKQLYVCGLDVFETYHPGHVSQFEAYNYETNNWEIIWKGEPKENLPEISTIFSPYFPVTKFPTDRIKMTMNCMQSSGWVEIDAIRMRGRNTYYWNFASHSEFSVTFRKKVAEFWVLMSPHHRLTRDMVILIITKLALLYDSE